MSSIAVNISFILHAFPFFSLGTWLYCFPEAVDHVEGECVPWAYSCLFPLSCMCTVHLMWFVIRGWMSVSHAAFLLSFSFPRGSLARNNVCVLSSPSYPRPDALGWTPGCILILFTGEEGPSLGPWRDCGSMRVNHRRHMSHQNKHILSRLPLEFDVMISVLFPDAEATTDLYYAGFHLLN